VLIRWIVERQDIASPQATGAERSRRNHAGRAATVGGHLLPAVLIRMVLAEASQTAPLPPPCSVAVLHPPLRVPRHGGGAVAVRRRSTRVTDSSPSTAGNAMAAHRTPTNDGVFFNKTGRRTGLGSAPRNNKATRVLTPPGRTSKSSARVSSRRVIKLPCARARPHFQRPSRGPTGPRPEPIRIRVRRAGEHRPVPAWILT
jgi:hypothetical protein